MPIVDILYVSKSKYGRFNIYILNLLYTNNGIDRLNFRGNAFYHWFHEMLLVSSLLYYICTKVQNIEKIKIQTLTE